MNFSGNIAYRLGVPTAAFTTFYSYRLLFMTFLNKTNSFKQSIAHAHEPKLCMSLPLILLSFGSLFIGYLTKDMIIGFGSSFRGNSVFILSENLSYLEAEYLPYHIKMIPFVFSHLGLVFAYHTTSFFFNSVSFCCSTTTNTSLNSFFFDTYFTNSFQKTIYLRELTLRFIPLSIYTFFSRTWGFDDFYNRLIVQKFMTFGYNISFRVFDLGWIAYLGPYGISKTVLFLSRKFSSLSTGFVYHYAFIILIGLLLFIFFAIPHFSTFFTFSGFESITVTLYFIFILTFFFLLSKTIKL
jgi:NADH-ubiquinone oxidoreductase chain 5